MERNKKFALGQGGELWWLFGSLPGCIVQTLVRAAWLWQMYPTVFWTLNKAVRWMCISTMLNVWTTAECFELYGRLVSSMCTLWTATQTFLNNNLIALQMSHVQRSFFLDRLSSLNPQFGAAHQWKSKAFSPGSSLSVHLAAFHTHWPQQLLYALNAWLIVWVSKRSCAEQK